MGEKECPECENEVKDGKIYTCEHCGDSMCSNCLKEHEKKLDEISEKFEKELRKLEKCIK